MEVARLTTVDNPHDPFENFTAWLNYDVASGYRTTELLGRISFPSEELSEWDANLVNTQAVDEIVAMNTTGMYRKVTRTVPDP